MTHEDEQLRLDAETVGAPTPGMVDNEGESDIDAQIDTQPSDPKRRRVVAVVVVLAVAAGAAGAFAASRHKAELTIIPDTPSTSLTAAAVTQPPGATPTVTTAPRITTSPTFSPTVSPTVSPTETPTVSPTETPTSPSGETATVLSSSSIRFSWTDNSNNEDGFRIWDGVSYTTVAAGVTSKEFTGYPPEKYMCFQVVAFNTVGFSATTPYACATTTA